MVIGASSTTRARRLRERRSRGVAMVAPVEIGAGGVALLVRNGLLKEHETRDRRAVGAACLAALEQWSEGRGARCAYRGVVNKYSGSGTGDHWAKVCGSA